MAPPGFSRAVRLTASTDFGRVFSGATKVADRHFTVLFRPNDGIGARLGMAVSRRTAPRAVARNRIKRLVRETFRVRRATLGSCDIVVIAKPAAREAGRIRLNKSLERLWLQVADRCPGC